MKERQIDLIGQSIVPIDPEYTKNGLSFTWELNFDYCKYFGIDRDEMDKKYGECNWWVNFYTTYNRQSGKIIAEYCLDMDVKRETFFWEFTPEEEEYVRKILNGWCMDDAGFSLPSWYDCFDPERE